MTTFWNKKQKSPPSAGRSCRTCGLELTDPLWKLCPRCRTETTVCGGCVDCGRCRR